MSKFIVKQSRARAGNRYRVAVLETTDGVMPLRIDDRLLNVVRVVKVWNDLTDPAQATSLAECLAGDLNQGPKVHQTPAPVPEFRCPNCQGTGDIPTFRHVVNGVCIRCNGSGKLNPSQQWNAFYPIYKNGDETTRKRIKWLFAATEANWKQLTTVQLRNVERWVNTTVRSEYALPQAATDRLHALVEAMPKPF